MYQNLKVCPACVKAAINSAQMSNNTVRRLAACAKMGTMRRPTISLSTEKPVAPCLYLPDTLALTSLPATSSFSEVMVW